MAVMEAVVRLKLIFQTKFQSLFFPEPVSQLNQFGRKMKVANEEGHKKRSAMVMAQCCHVVLACIVGFGISNAFNLFFS